MLTLLKEEMCHNNRMVFSVYLTFCQNNNQQLAFALTASIHGRKIWYNNIDINMQRMQTFFDKIGNYFLLLRNNSVIIS